jgi:hypothetical protein
MTTSRRSPRRSSRLKKSKDSDLFDSKQKYLDELIEKVNELKRELKCEMKHEIKNPTIHPAPLPKKDTAENRLFQIPFSKMAVDHYKGLEFKSHCVFRALHVLGLRSTSLCIEDSKRIFEMYDEDGASITNGDIAKYLSTIYETDVTGKVHKDNKMPYLDLQDGYATLVSIQTYDKDDVTKHDDDKSLNGTIIIVYKYKSVIYCYHPSSRINTVNINEILKELNTYRIEEYICFYKDSDVASLNRAKMVAPILY